MEPFRAEGPKSSWCVTSRTRNWLELHHSSRRHSRRRCKSEEWIFCFSVFFLRNLLHVTVSFHIFFCISTEVLMFQECAASDTGQPTSVGGWERQQQQLLGASGTRLRVWSPGLHQSPVCGGHRQRERKPRACQVLASVCGLTEQQIMTVM